MQLQKLKLPSKFNNWMGEQESVLDKLLASHKKYLIFEGPTGSGKTLVATSYHRAKGYNYTVYSCTTKRLQDQYMNDFSILAKDLKGRNNYPCLQSGIQNAAYCIETKDEECDLKEACPYRKRLVEVENAEVAVLNTWSLLCQINYADRFTNKTNRKNPIPRKLLILDEADSLEDAIIDFSTRSITENYCKKNYLAEPEWDREEIDYWKDWLDSNIKFLDSLIGKVDKETENKLKVTKNSLEFLWSNLNDTWVVEEIENGISVTPTDISYLAHKFIFDHYEKILLMSATFCGPEIYSRIMGIGKDEVDYIKLNSAIPLKRRPVYFIPVTKVTAMQGENALEKISSVINTILETFPDEQAIVHTVSNKNAEYWRKHCDVEIYDSNENKANLDRFLEKDIRCLASPSLTRGHDFSDDKCRINIIAKIPYPYLGSKSIKRRMERNKDWYIWKTAQDVVQMCGRSTRNSNDYSLTFILDAKFRDLIARARSLFPTWWLDSWKIISTGDIEFELLEEAKNGK